MGAKNTIKILAIEISAIGALMLLFAALAVSINASPVAAAAVREQPIPSGKAIQITLVNQEPDPVEPGSVFDVRFKVENSGSTNAEGVLVEILPAYPFSLYEDNAVKQIGSVHGRQIGEIGVIVKFKLKVDKEASAGEVPIKLRYSISGQTGWIETEEFTINVKAQDAILSIQDFQSVPEKINPGGTALLTINLKNLADFFIKDIKVVLSLSGTPFATTGSTNEKVIAYLDPNESTTLNFKIITEPGAEANVYKVPYRINYLDKLGTKYIKNGSIGLIVGAEPELMIELESSEVYTKRKAGKLIIKFINRGLTDIKFLTVTLLPSESYEIISSENVYIGDVDSDDYETAEFSVYVKKAEDGKVALPLSLEFKDANNDRYTENYNLELKLYSLSEAKKYGLRQGNSTLGIIITAAIIVGGFFAYRKWKKGRR